VINPPHCEAITGILSTPKAAGERFRSNYLTISALLGAYDIRCPVQQNLPEKENGERYYARRIVPL